jgi:hypothetical protein
MKPVYRCKTCNKVELENGTWDYPSTLKEGLAIYNKEVKIIKTFCPDCEEERMKGMVDVCAGKMTLSELSREISTEMFIRKPTQMIIDIRLKEDGYRATIWIPKKEFGKKR